MVNPSRSGDPRHPWAFRARLRRHAFGWKSQPAIQRVREAVAEIKKLARKDPMLAAEGAVLFLEKVSPACEQIDSSSGAIGTAVNHTPPQKDFTHGEGVFEYFLAERPEGDKATCQCFWDFVAA